MFRNIKSDPANHELCGASRMTTLSSGIPASVGIKNATFGVKRSFLKEYIGAHNTFCCICSNLPSFHGSPWRGGGKARQWERGSNSLHNVRSADRNTSISSPPHTAQSSLLFQPCFQLRRTGGNLLALILETLKNHST